MTLAEPEHEERHTGSRSMTLFEAQWPDVEARLRRLLAARNVPPSEREDLVQEVAVRALASAVEFPSSDNFFAWASTVARHLCVDVLRGRALAQSRLSALAHSPRDVEAEVETRLDLAAAKAFVAKLSAQEREALLGETGGVRQPSSFYVQRHRLRRKMQKAIDGLGSLWLGLWRRFRFTGGEAASQAAALVAPLAAACALNFGLGQSHDPRPHVPAEPAPLPAARATSHTHITPPSAPATHNGSATPHHPLTTSPEKPQRAPDPDAGRIWPERRVEATAADEDVYVETEKKHGQQPLWCLWGVVAVPDTCVGQAPNLDDLPG